MAKSVTKVEKIFKKNAEKFGGLKKVRIFAARLRENSLENVNKFIEKIEGKYKKQVPRKIQFIEKR